MGVVKTILVLLPIIVTIFIAYKINLVLQPPEPLAPLPETWWTNKDPKSVDNSIRPFQINVPQSILDDLQTRLNLAQKHTQPLENANFTYGFNTDYLRKLIPFWKSQYDWRAREKFLNKFPQYLVNVQGMDIHYIHVKPVPQKNVKILPLLLLHGWPGSVREFYRIIPMLTTPRNGVVFSVIAPSLPGYGFSEGATKPGLGAAQITTVMKNLMIKIGYNKFVVQGGDWGGVIAQAMAVMYPENLIGMHSNICFVQGMKTYFMTFLGSFYPRLVVEPENAHLLYPQKQKLMFMVEESGYLHIQATKPDTIGVALRESPIGLAVYILEKFSTWTDPAFRNLPDGGLTQKLTLTELLDNVMIYWVTGTITTSCRIYAETFNVAHEALRMSERLISVPSGCAHFPHEITYIPDTLLKYRFINLIHSTHMPRGGHFPAMEEPEMLADDVFKFVAKLKH